MPNFHHLYTHIRKYGNKHQPLYLLASMILFWTVFDSIMQYIAPLILVEHGYSNTVMGLIIGSSSVFGAGFDFLACNVIKNTNFRRIFLMMFAICSFYPLVLWQANTILIFIFAMAVWGVYYDLYNFGVFDFIGRYMPKKEHASCFGVAQVFRSLGQIIAPLIIGLIIFDVIDWRSFALGWVFLAIAAAFFITLFFLTRNQKELNSAQKKIRVKNLSAKIHLWKKIIRALFPALTLTMFLYIAEAFFWTIGPIYAETLGLGQFEGLFLTAYFLPPVLVGWWVGFLTTRLGKRRTAFMALLIGSLVLLTFCFVSSSLTILVSTFISSCFLGLALPSINSVYAGCLYDSPEIEAEIEATEDFFTNMGYVIGPILAGLLADLAGMANAFALLGLGGIMVAIILLCTSNTPIQIKIKAREL